MKDKDSSTITDLAFLLLLFFLILALSTTRTPADIELPESTHAEQIDDTQEKVFISTQGKVYYNSSQISLDQIPAADSITLYIDKDTSFSIVDSALEHISQKSGTIHIVTGAPHVTD